MHCLKKKVNRKKGLCGALNSNMLFPTKKKLNVSDHSGPRILGNKIKKTEIEKKRNTFFEVKFFQIFEFLRVFFAFSKR